MEIRLLAVLVFNSFLLVGCTHQVKGGNEPGDSEISLVTRPNILLIVADDMGYSDIGAYGGEIKTPNLDSLASEGVTLSRFYTSMTCAPTRAMLLSGVDNHRSGLGNMVETIADNQLGLAGYEGYLNESVLSIAELLGDEGYHTYMTGKWHLGMEHDESPRARGFERSFTLIGGGASHYTDRIGPDPWRTEAYYRKDGELFEDLPEDFYSTRDYTNYMLEYIDSQLGDGKPFFGYLAYTAPHWPLHAPQEEINKYAGIYDEGYDVMRKRRFDSLKELGFMPAGLEFPERPESVSSWDDLTSEEQERHARNMEIYAAMVDFMDSSIGRILGYLKEKGEYENTLIVFMSDNGADKWDEEPLGHPLANYASTFNNQLDNRGLPGSFVLYGDEGAHLSASPLKDYKGTASEGGIRAPAIIHWPGHVEAGIYNQQPISVLDIVPTFLDAAGAEYPEIEENDGQEIIPPSGVSVLPLLMDDSRTREGFKFGIEMWGLRAMVIDDWKVINMPVPVGTGEWQLYNVASDPAEKFDLMSEEPDQAQLMLDAWEHYREANGVVLPPWPPHIVTTPITPAR